MNNITRALVFGLLAVQMTCLHAAGGMEDAVLGFVREHTSGIAGRVEIQVDTPDARLRPLACASFEPFLPAGTRLWGRATVGVRCAGGRSTTLFVAVRIRVFAPAVVAVRPLAAGQVLSAADLRVEETEVAQPGFLSRIEQAQGQRLVVAVNAGFPVRQEMLASSKSSPRGTRSSCASRGRIRSHRRRHRLQPRDRRAIRAGPTRIGAHRDGNRAPRPRGRNAALDPSDPPPGAHSSIAFRSRYSL